MTCGSMERKSITDEDAMVLAVLLPLATNLQTLRYVRYVTLHNT